MDIYHVWCDLKDGVRDTDFVAAAEDYLDHLREQGLIEGYRITRRKLGLGPDHLSEFHLMLETRDLAQLDRAFGVVARRREPEESKHHAVNSLVRNTTFALYRDFPDPQRETGEERF